MTFAFYRGHSTFNLHSTTSTPMYLNTISTPLRHPWFDNPSMKRKQAPSDPSNRATKRHRSGTLERGFANLTLDAPMAPPVPVPVVEEPPMPPRPVTPTVPEITMKTSSWYEPERDRACALISNMRPELRLAPVGIVITDLDSYSDDEADASAETDTRTDAPVISPALIKRLATRPLNTLPAQPQTQALVLFRPLSSQIPPAPPEPNPAPADDAMDVEA